MRMQNGKPPVSRLRRGFMGSRVRASLHRGAPLAFTLGLTSFSLVSPAFGQDASSITQSNGSASTRPMGTITLPRSQDSQLLEIDPKLLEANSTTMLAKARTDIRMLQKQIQALQARVDAAEGARAQLTAQVGQIASALAKATAGLTSLRTSYDGHAHRVNGDVGNGFSTTTNGDNQTFSYMMPIRNNAAQYKARETSGPLPAQP